MHDAPAIHEEESPSSVMALSPLHDKARRMDETIGFAVIVEGIVYGVYSNARESAYIADSIRALGLVCEICHYE